MTVVLAGIASVTAWWSATPSPSPEPIVTSAPLESAERACAAGAGMCTFVEGLTGSATAGTWAQLLVGAPLRILLIVAVAVVMRFLLHRLIRRIVEQVASGADVAHTAGAADEAGEASRGWLGQSYQTVIESTPLARQRRAQRARTIGSVLRSVATGVIFVVTTLMVLAELGLNIAPLLASAGIVGVAVGFGAQSLVRDFLTGLFMLVEDQYGVGDSVILGQAVGTVESVGLRVTRVRDVNGVLWYVPNGQITSVGNSSQGWARAVVDVAVSHGQDLGRVHDILGRVGTDLREDPGWAGLVLAEPEYLGVEQLTAAGVVLRMTIKTAPSQAAIVAREARRRVQNAFEAEGISFPFSQPGVASGAVAQLPPGTRG